MEDAPKKRRYKKKADDIPMKDIPSAENENSAPIGSDSTPPVISDKLIQAVNDILKTTARESAQYKRQRERLITEEQIHGMLLEYLSGYVLVGYHATTGERIVIEYAETEAMADATSELLKVAVMKILAGGQQD